MLLAYRGAVTPYLHEEELVEEIGVAVVQSHAQGPVQHALAQRHERELLQSTHDTALVSKVPASPTS
jgi:hypothetical protein